MSSSSLRAPRERVHGILLLDKSVGLSSNAALQQARRLFNAAKAGHTGTLDPLASGLLPLCFGEATKFAQGLLDARKEYLAVVRFGIATSTGDAEGEPTAEAPVTFDAPALIAATRRFLGSSQQVPPRYAALKHEGRNYYEYARAGIEIPRPARTVEIDTLEVVSYVAEMAELRIGCSKGTYVRTLAEDLAHALGTVGHLAALRRVASGPFRLEQAITLEALQSLNRDERRAHLLAIDRALHGMPPVHFDAAATAALLQGRVVEQGGSESGRLRAYGPDDQFLGVVEATPVGLRPVRLVDGSALETD